MLAPVHMSYYTKSSVCIAVHTDEVSTNQRTITCRILIFRESHMVN